MIVIDAKIIIALILSLAHSDHATRRFTSWKTSTIDLYAPLLLQYEVVAVLRKAVVAE